MALYTLSGGPYGGTEADFPLNQKGEVIALPSERPNRVERYELRQCVNGWGEEIDGLFALFIGTATP